MLPKAVEKGRNQIELIHQRHSLSPLNHKAKAPNKAEPLQMGVQGVVVVAAVGEVGRRGSVWLQDW